MRVTPHSKNNIIQIFFTFVRYFVNKKNNIFSKRI